MRSRCARNACPVPCGEYVEVFVAVLHERVASVACEVGFEVLAVAILQACRAVGHHTYVEDISRANVQSIVGTEVVCMARLNGIRRLLLAVHAVDNLMEFVGMCRVEFNHTLCKLCLILLVEHVATAHAASHNVPKHVLSAYSLIVSLAHELAQNLYFVGRESILGAQCVHGHLRNALQHLVAIASDVQLNAVLEI